MSYEVAKAFRGQISASAYNECFALAYPHFWIDSRVVYLKKFLGYFFTAAAKDALRHEVCESILGKEIVYVPFPVAHTSRYYDRDDVARSLFYSRDWSGKNFVTRLVETDPDLTIGNQKIYAILEKAFGESIPTLAEKSQDEALIRALGRHQSSLIENIETSLLSASKDGLPGTIAALLDVGAPVNTMKGGQTPLMLASSRGSLATVEMLLSRGADPSLKNNLGQTAIDLARTGKHWRVVELLERQSNSHDEL